MSNFFADHCILHLKCRYTYADAFLMFLARQKIVAVLIHIVSFRFRVALYLVIEAAAMTNNTRATSYDPGNFAHQKRSTDSRLILSNGLSATPIGIAGEYVLFHDGTQSNIRFHKNPDAAAVFESNETGGWLHVSNAENIPIGSTWENGGVGAIEFDENGKVVGYERIANGTSKNCGGGSTAWRSWISGEEIETGRFMQVDPYGIKPLEYLESLGTLGSYESFAFDNHTGLPVFYTTRDHNNGIVTRFTPDEQGYACYQEPNDYDRWCTLQYGTLTYLHLMGDGLAEFTSDFQLASNNVQNVEGIDISNGTLYFTAKKRRLLYIVNLQTMEYDYEHTTSTTSDASGFEPDQIKSIPGDDKLYFCHEGGPSPGLHVRHGPGPYTTILYIDKIYTLSDNNETEETTSIAFSPDAKHLYVAFQEIGVLYDVTRDDLKSFKDETLGSVVSGASMFQPNLIWTFAILLCHVLAYVFR